MSNQHGTNENFYIVTIRKLHHPLLNLNSNYVFEKIVVIELHVNTFLVWHQADCDILKIKISYIFYVLPNYRAAL